MNQPPPQGPRCGMAEGASSMASVQPSTGHDLACLLGANRCHNPCIPGSAQERLKELRAQVDVRVAKLKAHMKKGWVPGRNG